MRMQWFNRHSTQAGKEPSLADYAASAVGLYDANRANGIGQLRDMAERLAANIRHELDVLAAVNAVLAREDASDAVEAITITVDEIAEAAAAPNVDPFEGHAGKPADVVAIASKRKRASKASLTLQAAE